MPGGERHIPYDLTYKWNLINKTNEQNRRRHGNKEQTDSDQRGWGKEIMGEKGKEQVKEHV